MSIWYDHKWSMTVKTAVDSLLYALVTGCIFSMMWPKMSRRHRPGSAQ